MKAIKITQENSSQIEQALREVNLGARAHTYTLASDIVDLASFGEGACVNLLSAKKHFAGGVIIATSGKAVPKSYKYRREATRVKIERRSADWYLTEVTATFIYTVGGGKTLVLTAEQDARAVEKFRSQYFISHLEKNDVYRD